jgi:hypothetical protein
LAISMHLAALCTTINGYDENIQSRANSRLRLAGRLLAKRRLRRSEPRDRHAKR